MKEASLACRKHASRVQVQLDAISAVVGNMNDIFQANAKTFTSLHVISYCLIVVCCIVLIAETMINSVAMKVKCVCLL